MAYEYSDTKFYGISYIGGSAAPQIETWPEAEPERKVVIPAAPQVGERVQHKARVKSSQSVSPVAVIGILCAAVLMVFVLMAKVSFTAVSDEAVALESQLADLKVEQTRLLIEYESAFNMTEIEQYATATLGMQRPRNEQVYYLNSSVPDKAVIIENQSESKGLLERLSDMLSSIGEYFS